MNNHKVLLREWMPLLKEDGFILESRDQNGGGLFLKGPMQRFDAPNQNGRIYPQRILQREYANMEKTVREGRATGELDHPEDSTVSLKNVSHVVREMWWDGPTWMGRIEILTNLPMGKIAEGLIEAGVTLGISSRGVGSTSANSSGVDIVQDDFTMVAYDLVQSPSTHNAYMTLGESRKILGRMDRADRINRALNDLKGGSK